MHERKHLVQLWTIDYSHCTTRIFSLRRTQTTWLFSSFSHRSYTSHWLVGRLNLNWFESRLEENNWLIDTSTFDWTFDWLMDACLLSWRWFFWYIDIDTWRQRYDDAPYDADLYLDERAVDGYAGEDGHDARARVSDVDHKTFDSKLLSTTVRIASMPCVVLFDWSLRTKHKSMARLVVLRNRTEMSHQLSSRSCWSFKPNEFGGCSHNSLR